MEASIKKLAFVTYSLNIGGVENVIFSLGNIFVANGYDVEIIETYKKGIWHNNFKKSGFKVVSLVRNPYISPIIHAKKIAAYLKKFDILFLNDVPMAQSVLGLLNPKTIIFPIMHMALPSMAINASGNKGQWTKIISVSPLLQNFLLNEIPALRDENIICIPNGIDTNVFVSGKKKNDIKKILYLGRISEEKGVLLIPEIIERIKSHKLFDKIDIYGTGPLIDELKIKINRFGLSQKINIKGAVDHEIVNKIIPDYDILLMPSYKEGHPIVLLEAMACEIVPVVSLLKGSTDIVIEQAVNGYLCQSGNVESFASNLVQALESSEIEQTGLKARKTIEAKFSLQIMSENYINLINEYSGSTIDRTNKIDKSLLSDLHYLPYILIRPTRKLLRLMGLWKRN